MRVNAQTSFSFDRGQYYDGLKNSLQNEPDNAKKELYNPHNNQKNKDGTDNKLSRLVAETTGIGMQLNFYI